MMIANSSMHAPYVRMGRGSYRVMCDVLIAMIPPIVWAVYVFGGRAVTMIVVGVTFASAADYSFRRFIFRKGNDFDVSAAVTGILIGFALPVSAPLWLPAFAALVAICVKYSAGGIGKNLFNPAASGICVSYLLFGKNMTVFTKPFASLPAFALSVPDAVLNEYGVATSLDLMRDGKVVTSSIADYFYGIEAGAIGAVSAALLTVSLIYLLIRRVSGVGALAGYLMGMLVLTFFTAYADCEPIDFAERLCNVSVNHGGQNRIRSRLCCVYRRYTILRNDSLRRVFRTPCVEYARPGYRQGNVAACLRQLCQEEH